MCCDHHCIYVREGCELDVSFGEGYLHMRPLGSHDWDFDCYMIHLAAKKRAYVQHPTYPVSGAHQIRTCMGYALDTYPRVRFEIIYGRARIHVSICIGLFWIWPHSVEERCGAAESIGLDGQGHKNGGGLALRQRWSSSASLPPLNEG
jgi:hypothetical protein